MNLKDLEFTLSRIADAGIFGNDERESLKTARDVIASLRAANDLPANFNPADLVTLVWHKSQLSEAPATLIHLPSSDGACYDRCAILPQGIGVLPAIEAANRVIYDVNRADMEADGLDSDSVEDGVRRGMEAIGFRFLPVERTIAWDGYHETPPALSEAAAALYARVPQPTPYVVYSANESALSDGAGFWSNDDGWTSIEAADRFVSVEGPPDFNLPVATGGDAKWLPLEEALVAYGGAPVQAS